MKTTLFVISWFLAGSLAFYTLLLHQRMAELTSLESRLQDAESRYQQQQNLNGEQRAEFETRIQQLQDNLLSAQNQMRNLSAALQEAREMIERVPAATPAPGTPPTTQ